MIRSIFFNQDSLPREVSVHHKGGNLQKCVFAHTFQKVKQEKKQNVNFFLDVSFY